MPDVYQWRVSATSHRDGINAMRQDLIDSQVAQRPFAIGIILDLIPFVSDQFQELSDRGNLEFSGSSVSNENDGETWVEINDPAMGVFSFTIPARVEAEMTVNGAEIQLEFVTPIELEIQRLSQMGVDRSAFQIFRSVKLSPSAVVSKMEDAADRSKETWVIVQLSQMVDITTRLPDSTSSVTVRASSYVGCGGPVSGSDWYVYRRIQGGLCLVHEGETIYGGPEAYEKKFGPSTESQCRNWIANNCEDDFCE